MNFVYYMWVKLIWLAASQLKREISYSWLSDTTIALLLTARYVALPTRCLSFISSSFSLKWIHYGTAHIQKLQMFVSSFRQTVVANLIHLVENHLIFTWICSILPPFFQWWHFSVCQSNRKRKWLFHAVGWAAVTLRNLRQQNHSCTFPRYRRIHFDIFP